MEMTTEQKQALAMASARARMAEQTPETPPMSPKDQFMQNLSMSGAMNKMNRSPEEIGGDVAGAAGRFLPAEVAGGLGLATNVGLSAVPMLLGGGAGKAAAPIVEAGARKLMNSAIKPVWSDLKVEGRVPSAIQTMFDNGVNATKGGMDKLRGMISDMNGQTASTLSNSAATVDKGAVASRLQDTINRVVKSNPTPQTALADVQKVYDDFLTNGFIPKNIPVAQAQEFKQGIYQMLKDKFGTLGSDTVEAQKALARGFKEEIASKVPDVVPLNARNSELINALKVANRRALMDGNKNPLGLATLTHSPESFLAHIASGSALAKSLAARGLYAGREALPEMAGAAAGSQLGNISDLMNR